MGFLKDFISLVYPRLCVCCDSLLLKDEDYLCNYCFVNLPKSHFEKDPDSELDKVFYGRVPVQKAASYLLFETSGKVQRILHNIKYKGNKTLGYKMGEWYGQTLKNNEVFTDYDVIIPVPLHLKKLRQRGFNQSEAFSRGLGKSLGLAVNDGVLKRAEYTSTQTRKTRAERWENVKGVFEVINPESIKNRKVLLVDDVITTGATLEACYAALENVEIDKLSVVSLAYAKRD